MTAGLAIVAIVLIALGLIVGWLLGGRAVHPVRLELARIGERAGQADRLQALFDTAEAERQRLEVEHGRAREQNHLLRSVREEVAADLEKALARHRAADDERERLAHELADLKARGEEQNAAHERLVLELKEVRESLPLQFSDVAKRALDDAQAKFLQRADERFKESEATAGQGLRALLAPVTERLQRYEEGVAKVEAERRDAFGDLKGQIDAMRIGTERVSGEAAKLVNALRNAPKARGRWGEQQLKNVFTSCGLSEHTDFSTEVSTTDEEGKRLRPDAILRIPGGKALVIDAKVSLNDYQDAFDAGDEIVRNTKLKAHVDSMRRHILGLSDKAYWDQFDEAPDYVIMFVPGEHFLTAALECDGKLWDYAFERRVILATPANLVAIARTVSAVWRQETLAKEARRIGELGKELYDRLAKVSEDLGKAGASLNLTVSHFNNATKSFNGNLTSTGKKFRDLKIETGKRELDDVLPVEALVGHASLSASPEHVTPLLPAAAD